jgi:hypothetical protein
MSAVTPLVHWNLQTLLVSTDHHSTFHNSPQSNVWILCRWSVDIFHLTISGTISCNIWLQYLQLRTARSWEGKYTSLRKIWKEVKSMCSVHGHSKLENNLFGHFSTETVMFCLQLFGFWTSPVVWLHNKDDSETQSLDGRVVSIYYSLWLNIKNYSHWMVNLC